MAKKTHEENHVELELEEEEIVVDEEEEEEVEKLEAEVNEMAQKILNYRTTLPDQLKSTLASILVSQRPVIGTNLDSVPESQPGTSNVPNPDAVGPSGSGNETLEAGGEDEDSQTIKLLKEKISSNVENIPIVLNRMKDCMRRIDQLESCNGIIHPAFKRKKTS
ncbi:hypothetical protein M9H77_33247 [Catharanthus roseus]|uniref:Uncharacterized protein n=1 Tax=Catharanthus roseus TaxID=4058 RepID=A0ACB9ZI43_CATRO|nr:hypothetical protein M9H77_33247 [Catharanthus roseus]